MDQICKVVFYSLLLLFIVTLLSSQQAEVPADSKDKLMSKFFLKKNCVVKIAKMAWLDEVSRKERGQDTAKDWKVDVDSDPRMLDVGDEIPLEQTGEAGIHCSGSKV